MRTKIYAIVLLSTIFSINCYSQNLLLTDSLIALYQFNGNAFDSTLNGNNGILHGPVYTSDRFGHSNGAIRLSGIGDYVEVLPVSNFKPQTLPVTVCAWVKYIGITDSLGQRTGQVFMNDLAVNGNIYGIVLNITSVTNVIALSYTDGGAIGTGSRRTKLGTTNLGDDKWHFIVGVIRGALDMDIYVDGVNDGGTYSGTGGSLKYSTNKGSIGRGVPCASGCTPFTYFKGDIDEIRFYHRALNIGEVLELYGLTTSDCFARFIAQAHKDSVTFINLSSSAIKTADWDFGDGTFSTNTYINSSFSHHYTLPGDYNVCLVTSDTSGTCLDTFCTTVRQCNTKASFTFTKAGNTITSTSTSTNAGVVHWSFGDGSADNTNQQVISHPFNIPGQYRITLQVWDDSTFQCFDSISQLIWVAINYNLTDSLIAYYEFNGTSFDSTSNHNNGTLHGPIFTNDRFGNPGGAINLNGINNYLDVVPGKNFKPTNFPISICAWVKYIGITDTFGQRAGQIFMNDLAVNGTIYGVVLNIVGTTNVVALSYTDGGPIGTGSRRTKMGTTNLGDDKWHFIAGVIRSAQDMDIYVDGVNDGGSYSGTGGTLAYNNNNGSIGRGVPCASGCAPFTYFKGDIDEIRFFHRELTLYDVLSLYNLSTSDCFAHFTARSKNDSVSFQNFSAASIKNALWDFGDGTTSNNTYIHSTFSHHYNSAGDYNVCLMTSDSTGTCLDTFCTTVHQCNTHASFTIDQSGNTITCTSSSTNSGILHWSFGNGSSDRNNLSTISYSYPFAGQYKVSLQVWDDSIMQCFDSTSIIITVTIPTPDTLSGIVFNDLNGDGERDVNEIGMSDIKVILGDNSVSFAELVTGSNGKFSFAVGNGVWNISIKYPDSWTQTLPVNPGSYTFQDTTSQNISGFDFGLHNNRVTISGTIFYDSNNNGFQDVGETGIPYQRVKIENKWYYGNENGVYSATLQPGNYIIKYDSPLRGYSISTPAGDAYNIAASDSGQIYNENNFGLWADPNLKDLAVAISPFSNVARGFEVAYLISYTNFGVNTVDGTIEMNYDSTFTLNTAEGGPIVDAVNHNITWDLGSLSPGEYGSIICWFIVPQTSALGSKVKNSVQISPLAGDNTPDDNTDEVIQTVVGSFDPNDKIVSPEGPIRREQKLNYIIDFQNTGTAPAVNIVVVDSLPIGLDLTTFKMESASHAYTLKIDENRVAKWTFTNIMLPDSGTSLKGSMGFVKFSVYPDANISNGMPINNFGDIYFDFNEPVRTNTVQNMIDLTLESSDISTQYTTSISPNPMGNYSSIMVTAPISKDYVINISNILGETMCILKGRTGERLQIEKGGLSSGLYIYKVSIDGIKVGQGKIAVK